MGLIIFTLFLEIFLASHKFSGLNFYAFLGIVFSIFLGLVTVFEFPVYLTEYLVGFKHNKSKPLEDISFKHYENYLENINFFEISSFREVVKSTCVYFYSFAYHGGSLIIIKNFKNKSEACIKKVFADSVWITFTVYYLVMLLGYLGNLQYTQEVFINRPNQSIYLLIAKVLYSASLIFNIGFTYVLSKKYMENLFTLGNRDLLSKERRVVITFAVLTILMCLTFTFDSIINALSLIGGSTQTVQMFIIPFILYARKPETSRTKRIIAYTLMVVLFTMGIFSFGIFILDFVHKLSEISTN